MTSCPRQNLQSPQRDPRLCLAASIREWQSSYGNSRRRARRTSFLRPRAMRELPRRRRHRPARHHDLRAEYHELVLRHNLHKLPTSCLLFITSSAYVKPPLLFRLRDCLKASPVTSTHTAVPQLFPPHSASLPVASSPPLLTGRIPAPTSLSACCIVCKPARSHSRPTIPGRSPCSSMGRPHEKLHGSIVRRKAKCCAAVRQDDASAFNALKASRASMLSPKLVPPGERLHGRNMSCIPKGCLHSRIGRDKGIRKAGNSRGAEVCAGCRAAVRGAEIWREHVARS
jgi:hypothetical protein